ncbi:IS1595 family transposase [Rhodohalobacter sulfatireducens]|uniref:IS1595 family transposase n=1 Tax=Rhodohalobacter sulfatireducens TaxID=2911366 RepID=A0ABS9KAW8_9BACT|nr:IS1595 family transposase [Rhodohalobacter sulfatireducens]MCG2587995.1 IS1595 family transposase [Rhodohalobacter sulfatireducens]
MKNKYVNRSKISEAKFRQLIRYFSLDLTAIQITELIGLNRNTVNRYLTEIRKKILTYSSAISPLTEVNISCLDTSNFDSLCVLIREMDGQIYTETIPKEVAWNPDNTLKNEDLQKTGYDLVIDFETGKQFFLKENSIGSENHQRMKINRIESFWGNAKSRLAKFKGMHSSTLKYHVKECEFRFNNRNKDLYQLLLKILRNDPLF